MIGAFLGVAQAGKTLYDSAKNLKRGMGEISSNVAADPKFQAFVNKVELQKQNLQKQRDLKKKAAPFKKKIANGELTLTQGVEKKPLSPSTNKKSSETFQMSPQTEEKVRGLGFTGTQTSFSKNPTTKSVNAKPIAPATNRMANATFQMPQTEAKIRGLGFTDK